jgi:integrase
MSVYKRGKVYWYDFYFKGARYRDTTRQGTKRVAEQIEAAIKTRLAKGEVGLEEKRPVPTLTEFAPRFEKAIEAQCARKPRTVSFYKAKLRALLANAKLAAMRLDAIEEAQIEEHVQARIIAISRRKKPFAPGSINRELATLRRLLRLANEWKEIDRVPRIRLLKGERYRKFVLAPFQEPTYLAALPAPLCDVAIILLDTGFRIGEALSLEWPEVNFEPAERAKFGSVKVLAEKAKNHKERSVPLSERAASVLKRWTRTTGFVFHRRNGSPLAASQLDQQHARIRALLRFSPEFVLHSLRHTFGTRLGEVADAFTIMTIMGHSSITISQRYVHPSTETVELAFERKMAMDRHRLPTVLPTVPSAGIAPIV